MADRGTGRKAKEPSPKSVTHKEKDVIIASLQGKIRNLEQFNKSLSRENTAQGELIGTLQNKLEASLPEGELEELSVVKPPEDMVKVKVVRKGYSIQLTDFEGVPHNYITGDVFEVSALDIQFYPSGAIVPVSELDE